MTIEKEAEDCVYPENNPMDAFWKIICDEHPCIGEELESIRFRITKALQAKQDRINELETLLSGKTGFCVECEKKAKRIDELEIALKECVSALEAVVIKMGHINDSIHVCSVCSKIDSAMDRVKKALGYTQGEEG